MTIGIILLTLCAVLGVVIFFLASRELSLAERSAEGFRWFAVPAAVVLVLWFIVAVPYSTYERNSCRAEAKGYGLDYDWSMRNGCKVYLPSGQLVPVEDIRITSDGQIIAGGEG